MKRFCLALCALILVLPGCKRIPMHERTSGVYLKLNLHRELHPDQEALLDPESHPVLKEKVVGSVPELLRVCFYDAVSHQLAAEDFLPAKGGFVHVPAGSYDIEVYSLGTATTQVSGTDSRAAGYAFTSPTGVLVRAQTAPSTDAQPVVLEPDQLFAGVLPGAVIEVRPEDAAETQMLTVEVNRVPESWKIDVMRVEHAENIGSAEFYVTGQADGRFLWDGRSVNHPCALGFPASVDVAAGTISAVFNTFGKYPQPESDVQVSLLVTSKGGNRWRYVFDATTQWLNPDNTARHIVIDDRLDIPGDDTQGGGFDPLVTDWDGEEITIILE